VADSAQHTPMDKEELEEIMSLLGAAGVNAMLCDQLVPLSSSPVKCGVPTEPGDTDLSEYLLLPRSVVGNHPEMFITVDGDSMKDVNYNQGDRIRVRFGVPAYDGDNVLVSIGRDCTVKTLFHDDQNLTWLVPQNDEYDAILLDSQTEDVRILGVVVAVEKAQERVSYNSCRKKVQNTKQKMRKARKLDEWQINRALERISVNVKHARQWYAVFRALVDRELEKAENLPAFCSHVSELFPEHPHLPSARNLEQLAVQSFTKPLPMWRESNAPVGGTRFRDYKLIAQKMLDLLSDEDLGLETSDE